MPDQRLKPYTRTRNALPAQEFAALKQALLDSPLLGHSTLGGTFEGSRGFAITFTAEGRARVVERTPALAPFFALAIDRQGPRALRPWYRPGVPVRTPNAWYLNVLVIADQGRVGRHVDATLQGPAQAPHTTPEAVSVLYLSVPQGKGGALVLHDGPRELARLPPREGTLLHFRGDLSHEVSALEAPAGARRASLVLEQYHFAPEPLGRLPALQIDSRAGFEAFLAEHRKKPPASFTLE